MLVLMQEWYVLHLRFANEEHNAVAFLEYLAQQDVDVLKIQLALVTTKDTMAQLYGFGKHQEIHKANILSIFF
ncbi:MAG: hypothetical protein HC865_00300 [Cyanobacteria bacterium RU_5_0]|nr:hypothetical protein [Cyanobacteria bacterium RU_5_0]